MIWAVRQGRDRNPTPLIPRRGFFQKIDQRLAVVGRADDLLGHFGAGRVSHRADLEQLGDGLLGPDNIELLQRIGKVIAGQRRDAAAEQASERRTGAIALVGA